MSACQNSSSGRSSRRHAQRRVRRRVAERRRLDVEGLRRSLVGLHAELGQSQDQLLVPLVFRAFRVPRRVVYPTVRNG